MNNKSNPKPMGFFSVFLLSVMLTVEGLTLLFLWWLQQFPMSALIIVGCLMVILSSMSLRLFMGKRSKRLRLRRVTGGALSLCITGFWLCVSAAAFVTGSTFDNMFGSTQLGGVPSVTPNHPAAEAFAVYLSGSDTRGSKLTKSRSDVNIIAVVSPETKQLLLVNTPRDYYVSNPAGNGAKDKLAHCGLYGTDNSQQALANLYNIPIAYAAQINFKGFETLIDALGGVTVVSDTAFTTTDGGYTIQKGENVLDGKKALAFARERSHLAGGDVSRGKNQMQLITALIRQASPTNLIANYREILDSLEGMFVTNMPLRTITTLVTTQLTDFNQWELFSYSVTGRDGNDYNYSSGSSAYVMYPDADSVSHASALMQQLLRDEAITQEAVG